MEWEYCDIIMLRVPEHRNSARDQIQEYLRFIRAHRVLKIIHLECDEMMAVAPEICKLENVVNITSTPMTIRNGTWNVLVNTSIKDAELLAIDSILRNCTRAKEPKWKDGPFRRSKNLDHMNTNYLSTIHKQYTERSIAPGIRYTIDNVKDGKFTNG